MLRTIYAYELKSLMKQPAVYFYFIVFFGIALVALLGTGGFFDDMPQYETANRLLNSPYEIHLNFQYFNRFFLFLLPTIIGASIYKDYGNNVYPILYSYALKKSDYLAGKFLSSLTVVFFINISVGVALFLGEIMLGQQNPLMGSTSSWGYLSAYLFFIWPNMFVYGVFVFVAVAVLRNIYAGFICIILLLFLQTIIDSLFAGTPFLQALVEPFGQNALTYETLYWTLAEQNSQPIPLSGMVLYNRMLWSAIAFLLFTVFYRKFRFEQNALYFIPGYCIRKQKRKPYTKQVDVLSQSTKAAISFSFSAQVKAMRHLSVVNLRFITKSRLFHVLVFFGILALVFAMSRVTNRNDMTFLPLTRIVLGVPMHFFSLIIMLLTFVYSGMLIHRSRIAKTHQIVDTTATSNWVFSGATLLSLLLVQIILLLVMMLCGIGLQLYNGYHHFEIRLYLFHLFIIALPPLIIWAALSLYVHTIVPNVYAGIFLLLLIWIGKDQLSQIGITTYLLRFNSPPAIVYSDLNGFGHGLKAYLHITLYWQFFSAVLVVISIMLRHRGYTYTPVERLRQFIRQLNGPTLLAIGLFIALGTLQGFKIYKEETKSLSHSKTDKAILEKFKADFENYKSAIQPKIVSIQLRLDIFPETRSFVAKGKYVLVNTSAQNIDTLLIKTGFDENTAIALSVSSKTVVKDDYMKYAVHMLNEPIAPGDSVQLDFTVKNKPNSLFIRHSGILRNGTFLRTDILPRLGYAFTDEYDLPDDSVSSASNFYSRDADLVDMETVISTNASQTAIAPGTLKKQWTENSRNYFHYKTDVKTKFAFAFSSAQYSITRSMHKGVNIEIYHHNKHAYNLKEIIAGLKASLDYNTEFFSAFPYADIRSFEFPITEGTYASLMGNTIPTAEARFVVSNNEAGSKINLSFYTQAHELTHQWWGNQVVPANALGAKMITESITEYISLRIYEKHFGWAKAQQFLSLQRKRYLQGRTEDAIAENPLYLVHPTQEYIAYGKGTMAFNALQYYVGENKLNEMLRAFLEIHRFGTQANPTSTDLIGHLKKETPPHLHYIINDMMETVTFYDNYINAVDELPNNQLAITFSLKKTEGTKQKAVEASNVFITIGQYNKEGHLLNLKTVNASTGSNSISIKKHPEVSMIVLDPLLHFIEYNIENNRYSVANRP